MMIYGLSHIEMDVASLTETVRLYTEYLGFEVISQAEQRAEMQQGMFNLYLMERPDPRPITLWLEVAEPDVLAQTLVEQGCQLLTPPCAQDQRRIAEIQDLAGHLWILWRPLKETEYESLPALPKTLPWEPEAETLLQNLLLEVPEYFRKGARLTATVESEALATEQVGCQEAVRGYIRSAPYPMRDNVKKPLAKFGYDWQAFREDFEEEGDME